MGEEFSAWKMVLAEVMGGEVIVTPILPAGHALRIPNGHGYDCANGHVCGRDHDVCARDHDARGHGGRGNAFRESGRENDASAACDPHANGYHASGQHANGHDRDRVHDERVQTLQARQC